MPAQNKSRQPRWTGQDESSTLRPATVKPRELCLDVLYRVHFAATPDEPMPVIDELVAVEADSPERAATLLMESGRVPQDQSLKWACVVVAVHPNGRPKLVMRYPLTPVAKILVDSTPRTCEDRTLELNSLRQKKPQRLIAIYRAATNTPEPQQLPRGLGFDGMIEAILKYELATTTEQLDVAAAKMQAEVATAKVQDESQNVTQIVSESANDFVVVPQSPRTHTTEFRAFCQGGAMVLTGLLLAVLYCFARIS